MTCFLQTRFEIFTFKFFKYMSDNEMENIITNENAQRHNCNILKLIILSCTQMSRVEQYSLCFKIVY